MWSLSGNWIFVNINLRLIWRNPSNEMMPVKRRLWWNGLTLNAEEARGEEALCMDCPRPCDWFFHMLITPFFCPIRQINRLRRCIFFPAFCLWIALNTIKHQFAFLRKHLLVSRLLAPLSFTVKGGKRCKSVCPKRFKKEQKSVSTIHPNSLITTLSVQSSQSQSNLSFYSYINFIRTH